MKEYVSKYSETRRAVTMDMALALADTIPMTSIVETGCYRGCAGDGMSTLILAMYAKERGASFDSVDNCQAHVELARQLLENNNVSGTVHHADSIVWIGQFWKPISFLYLDSFDYDGGYPIASQTHDLAEFAAALRLISNPCVLLVDDADLPGGGKPGLLLDFAVRRGWTVAGRDYQVILKNF